MLEPATSELPTTHRTRPAPELVAAAVSALVVVAVVLASVVRGTGPTGPGGPMASGTPAPSGEASARPIDMALVTLLTEANGALNGLAAQLRGHVDAQAINAADTVDTMRTVGSQARTASDYARSLASEPDGGEVSRELLAGYGQLRATTATALEVSVSDPEGVRAAATTVIAALEIVPTLQGRLDAWVLTAGTPPTPPPSVAPSPSAPPSVAPPSPTPAPPASDDPSGAPPTPTPSAGGPVVNEQVDNPGFEDGVGPPWAFHLLGNAQAVLVPDTSGPAAGSTAARIDITAPGTGRSGISLSQPAISVAAGGRYEIRVDLRASQPRVVSLRLVSASGGTYGGDEVVVDGTWRTYVVEFTAPTNDQQAVLAIEVGQETATTWVDSVGFREIHSTIP